MSKLHFCGFFLHDRLKSMLFARPEKEEYKSISSRKFQNGVSSFCIFCSSNIFEEIYFLTFVRFGDF